MAVRRVTPETYGGIDPGKHGRLVLYDGFGIAMSDPMPFTGSEVDARALCKILIRWKARRCRLVMVEHQRSYGVEGPSRLWSLAEGYGVIKAALRIVGIPSELIEPHTSDRKGWKDRLRLPSPETGVPKLPRLKKGATPEQKAAWEAEHKEAKKRRDAAKRTRKARLKEIAVVMAKRLAPSHPFRREGSEKDDDGEAEAFLLSVLAMRVHRGSDA